ncbi:MAG: hypothetical protein PHX83_06995 [Acidobacteriia bacterium]|nr:hypothetical protein [Terriglobia bacterium]
MKIEYDSETDMLSIEGIKYSGYVFRGLKTFPLGEKFEIVNRSDGGVLTIRSLTPEIVMNGVLRMERCVESIKKFFAGSEVWLKFQKEGISQQAAEQMAEAFLSAADSEDVG